MFFFFFFSNPNQRHEKRDDPNIKGDGNRHRQMNRRFLSRNLYREREGGMEENEYPKITKQDIESLENTTLGIHASQIQ